MKSRPCCLEADAIRNTEIDFQYILARPCNPHYFPLNWPSFAHGVRLASLAQPSLNMSAGFSGHLPERMLWAWRPGSEGDWCLCHPSQQLPLSWCIIEPLNQLFSSLSPAAQLSTMVRTKKKKKQRGTDRGVKVTSLFFSYLHLRCYGLALPNRTTMDGEAEGLVWALVSGFNCPLCQIGDNKQFEALSCHCLSPPAYSEAADRTLKPDVSVRGVNLSCDGVANIMASFIDTDCSDTSKSGPINLHTGAGVTGAVRARRRRQSDKCLFDLLYQRHGCSDWKMAA